MLVSVILLIEVCVMLRYSVFRAMKVIHCRFEHFAIARMTLFLVLSGLSAGSLQDLRGRSFGSSTRLRHDRTHIGLIPTRPKAPFPYVRTLTLRQAKPIVILVPPKELRHKSFS